MCKTVSYDDRNQNSLFPSRDKKRCRAPSNGWWFKAQALAGSLSPLYHTGSDFSARSFRFVLESWNWTPTGLFRSWNIYHLIRITLPKKNLIKHLFSANQSNENLLRQTNADLRSSENRLRVAIEYLAFIDGKRRYARQHWDNHLVIFYTFRSRGHTIGKCRHLLTTIFTIGSSVWSAVFPHQFSVLRRTSFVFRPPSVSPVSRFPFPVSRFRLSLPSFLSVLASFAVIDLPPLLFRQSPDVNSPDGGKFETTPSCLSDQLCPDW